MAKTKYDLELLNKLILDSSATLIGDYPKIKSTIFINFICICGNNRTNKLFIINNIGAYCKSCCKIKALNKRIKTNLDKYGVSNPNKTKIVRDKIVKTNLERYGVSNPAKITEVKEKIVKTNLERYGVSYHSQNSLVKEKKVKRSLEKYGVLNPNQCQEVRDKIINTNIQRYGCENPNQNCLVAEKSSKNAFKFKEYRLPSGTAIRVQGYEPKALDILLKSYSENQLVISDRTKVPEIWWTDTKDKRHRYYVDIYIPEENRLIEVKSDWTYKRVSPINNEKIKQIPIQCIAQGYKYEYWIFDSKGKLTIINEFPVTT